MKILLGILALMILATSARADTMVDCDALSVEMNAKVIDWSYTKFEEKGWRTLASKKCFFAAGSSIVTWLSAHQATVTDAQSRTLRYHAARVFAMTGRTRVALVHLNHADNPDQPEGATPDWNSYIDAFSAWLRRDLADLRASIETLKLQAVDETGDRPNLVAAKRFLICYSLPYPAIETDPACIEKQPEPDKVTTLRRSPEQPKPIVQQEYINQ